MKNPLMIKALTSMKIKEKIQVYNL